VALQLAAHPPVAEEEGKGLVSLQVSGQAETLHAWGVVLTQAAHSLHALYMLLGSSCKVHLAIACRNINDMNVSRSRRLFRHESKVHIDILFRVL
jgi:hypothetical protein